MPIPRRRGDSDDEGAAPPVNHRYSIANPMGSGSGSVGTGVNSNSMNASSPAHYGATAAGTSSIDRSRGVAFGRSYTGPSTRRRQSTAITANNRGFGAGGSSHGTSAHHRYGSGNKPTKLPSRWILDLRDRAIMGATASDRTTLKLSHGHSGSKTFVEALPGGHGKNNGEKSSTVRDHCLVVTDHSIPVDHLKEIALKTGDQQNGTNISDDLSSGGTIDQILSNLRSKPFGGRVTAKRASSASLYPTLPGDRSNARDWSSSSSTGRSKSPIPPSTRKTISSPVYYFEITLQSLPPDALVSVGMVISDDPPAKDGNNSPDIPGEVKNSIGVCSNGVLKVSGKTIDEKKFGLLEAFQAGDVIGCGLEVVGTRRILFTKNGKTMIPPTRFSDVEAKYNAYSPSLGIIIPPGSGCVAASANFGTRSGETFRWEESELLHIVNVSLIQSDEEQPRPLTPSGAIVASPSSRPQQAEFQEQRPALPSQQYHFGQPSAPNGGLLESNESLPAYAGRQSGNCILDGNLLDDTENDDNNNFGSSSQHSQQVNRVQSETPFSGPTTPSTTKPRSKSPPPPKTGSHLPSAQKVARSPSGKTPGRTKSPRMLFNFGKGNKKNVQAGSKDDRNSLDAYSGSDTDRDSRKQKPQAESNSTSFFGSIRKKKKGGGLLDDEDDEDENDADQNQHTSHKAASQYVPSQMHMKSSHAQGMASFPISDPGTAPAIGISADGHGPAAFKPAPPSHTQQSSQSEAFGATARLSAQTSSSGAPLLFGKKSKKASLDDDNPNDVELQASISNSFPAGVTTSKRGASGTVDVSAIAGATGSLHAVKSGPAGISAAPVLYGKKSKKTSLEDDDPEENRLQDSFGSMGNPSGPQLSDPTLFGRKSKKGSNDNDPKDDNAQANFGQNLVSPSKQAQISGATAKAPNSAMYASQSQSNSPENGSGDHQQDHKVNLGSKSKKSSLEDDDPEDDRYQNHSRLPAGFGMPNSQGSLEDNGSGSNHYRNNASIMSKAPPKKFNEIMNNQAGDRFHTLQSTQRQNPQSGIGTAVQGHHNSLYGSRSPQSSGMNEDGDADVTTLSSTIVLPEQSIREEDTQRDPLQSHGNVYGFKSSSNHDNFSGNIDLDVHRNFGPERNQATSVRSADPFMQVDTRPREFGAGTPVGRSNQNRRQSHHFGSRPSNSALLHPDREVADNPHDSCQDQISSRRGRHSISYAPPMNSSMPVRSPLSPSTLPSSSAAHAPSGASEEDMLNAAIEESKRDQQKQEMKTNSAPLTDSDEIETIRENTRTLRSLCSDEGVDASILESLLECCREDRAKVQASLESDDPRVDLMEMLSLNELVQDAIQMGEKLVEGSKKKSSTSSRSSKTNLNLDIGALVEKKDIFSLICILRAQSDQRLDAALALMNFAREADALAEAGTRSLRDEIRSSGGMHSLITVFRSKGASYELRVVSALAVAYVLPSFIESSSVHPSVGLKIMECLRFLSTSRPVTPSGTRISRDEMYKAAAMGVTTFWMNELTPLLNAGMPKTDSPAERSDLFSRTSKKGKRRGRTGGQRHQTLELQELLEMTVSLIVQIERLGESDMMKNHRTPQTDSLFLWRYTNVEQVCAVDVARPIAVREGLLPILVGWIRSKDREKVRPAVSALRYLTSIKDKYMAGWIHSQMVNEGALGEVVKLADDYYVGQDVRLAVAQILASLCVAPHTRAAVVEAKCINYLIGFLYDHSDAASQDVALFAGSAILQLAEGAITRASVLGGGDMELQDGASPDKSDNLVDDIVNSGAIGSFIAIAINHGGKLRSMAIEAIRVLSEDTSPSRRTRSQLCEEGAAMALGRALKDDVSSLHSSMTNETYGIIQKDLSLDELHDALCALANILEPIQPGNAATTKLRFVPSNSDPTQNLIQGCIETAESGGLDSLLWISSLPLTGTTITDSTEFSVQRIDLLEEACRSLASLSPLLLSKEPAAQGYARCADSIFEAFDRILILDSFPTIYDEDNDENDYEQEAMLELSISALRGLGALATAEPLKIKIVDKTLPCLLQMRNSQGNGSDVSNVVGQVFLSLGFEEDEIAVQVAGSNPNLLADWFCLQRSLIIQAMARSEIRRLLLHIWKVPFTETKKDVVTRLIRETNVKRTTDENISAESFAESFAEVDLFESYADDDYTEQLRSSMTRQYHEFYNMGAPRQAFGCGNMDRPHDEVSLLARHMYPLSDTQAEIDWMLSHDESIYSKPSIEPSVCTQVSAPGHVEALLDCCFPSRLLRNHVVPIFSVRPEATFNFRSLTMPQRRYFSFRREGQLISRLCDKQAETLDFDDVHWTLGFMNSTFAGEFSETFVQALYLCPTIRGLSFGKNEDYSRLRALDGDDENSDDGKASLANLVGSLPPWIQSLTFSNILGDREVKTLVGIIETMGKLSPDQTSRAMGGYPSRGRDASSTAQTPGKFWSFAICCSLGVSQEVWLSFFCLLGRSRSLEMMTTSSPLSSLKVLDLSFNNLGDEACSMLLDVIHDPESGCRLEQLDLSGNAIRKGTRVVSVLRRYVDQHRFNSVTVDGTVWQASLHTLNLSVNNLSVGAAATEIIGMLEQNALSLKILDLSSNGFDSSNVDNELSQVLVNSLESNTSLCNLNLSNNSFSPEFLDNIFRQLSESEVDIPLAFLGFDNNTPPLSPKQEDCLELFLRKSRRVTLQKCLKERDAVMNGELFESDHVTDASSQHSGFLRSDLSSIKESTVLKDEASDFTKSGFDEPEGEPGDNMITVLFSAPLVFTNERRQLKPFAKLDFDMERELMWQCMKEASRDIELFFDNATHDRLLAAITKRCSCLHYSGHGHPSYLPFEDGGGGPNWFKVEDIQRLIAREGVAPFKFVFVSACHSGLAGETFASAGVPHVVCCQQEFELKDTAALAFTRQFYLSLVIGHTVRESFEQGCKAVRATPNLRDSEKEMKKFLLLPKDGNHDVPIFNAKAVVEWPKVNARQLLRSRSSKKSKSISRIRNLHAGGARSSELGVRNMMQEDPSPTPPQFFLGREVEMYYVLKAILGKRLVSVVAEPGVGRSSLVCALCHYINERASTILAIERIYFVKAKRSRRVDGCRALMEQLLRKLVESGKEDPPDPGVDMEDLFDFICKSLKNEKALVVFDRMEYLENSDDAEEFPMLLSTLFRGTKNVKVLVTGRRPLGIPSLGGQVEYPFPLGPLTFENTLRLFANLCPHLHTAGERHKLFERLATDGEQSELKPSDTGISERTKAIFKTIGDGIPSRIEQAAYDISSDNLRSMLDRHG